MQGVRDLSFYLGANVPIEYHAWKKYRNSVLQIIGADLIALPDDTILSTYEQWEYSIKEKGTQHGSIGDMELLLQISILHYFQRESNAIKHFLPIISGLVQSENINIIRACTQVIHWILEESSHKQLFASLIEQAFTWIRGKSDKIVNGLFIIKKTKGFLEIGLITQIQFSFGIFYQILSSDNFTHRIAAFNIMSFVLKNQPSNSALIPNYLHDCLKAISNNPTANAHGPLLLLTTIFEINPSLFVRQKSSFLSSILNLTKHESTLLSIDAFKFLLSIAKYNLTTFNEETLNEFIQNLFDKCAEEEEPTEFYNLIIDVFNIFDEVVIPQIIAFLEDMLIDSYETIDIEEPFKVLAEILTKYPDTQFNHEVFKIATICDGGIRCLMLMPAINADVQNELIDFVKNGLKPTEKPETVLLALKLLRVFDEEIFDRSDAFFEALKPLEAFPQESIKLEMVRVMPHVANDDSIDFILNAALFDEFDSVRMLAISLLKPSQVLSTNQLLPQLLSDPNIEFKKRGIELVAEMEPLNPFGLSGSIVEFVEELMTSVASLEDFKRAADLASLLPVASKLASKAIRPFIESIIVACVNLICPGMGPIPHDNALYQCDQVYEKNPMEVPTPEAFVVIVKKPPESPLKKGLFSHLNQSNIDRRDAHLLETLAEFPNDIEPFLDHVLMAFYQVFTTRHDDNLLRTAAMALSKIASNVYTGLNLRIYAPQFVPALTRVIQQPHRKEVITAILNLLGTSVDSFDAISSHEIGSQELGVDLCNDSYYTDFALTHLSVYFGAPRHELLEAVTRIFESAPKDAAKFVEQVIKMFIRAINNAKVSQLGTLFSYLEQITSSCPEETQPYLTDLSECLLNHVDSPGCMLLCSCLSYKFMNIFTPFCRLLYVAALGCLSNYSNFAETLKFLAFAVCFQSQPLSLLVDVLENITKNKAMLMKYRMKISKNLCFIVQTRDVSMLQTRIARIVRALFSVDHKDPLSISLAFSLVLSCQMPVNVMRRIIPPSIDTSALEKALQAGCIDLRRSGCVELTIIKFDPTKIDIPAKEDPDEFFKTIKVPTEPSVKVWLDELCRSVVRCSPSDVIRSCASFVEVEPEFKNALFPVAFLSCWENISVENQNYFSNIFASIMRQHSKIDETLMQLAEICDRALLPFNVGNLVLSSHCTSKPLALFFLQKELTKTDKTDKKKYKPVIEQLIALNNSMGRNASARGLLKEAGNLTDSVARWNEWLRDWKTALELYPKTKDTLSHRIRCHAHLQQWDEIRKLEPEYLEMTKSEQEQNARHFAWAFYHAGDMQKVARIVRNFPKELTTTDIIFLAVYAMKQNRLQDVKDLVKRGFNLLSKDTSMYGGGDVNMADINLNSTQLLVELKEARRLKKQKNVRPEDVWTNRLKGFKRDGDTWIKLIDIRSLVVAPDARSGIYLKMLSVLRKEGRWDIIDKYTKDFDGKEFAPEIELALAKISWARGRKDEAVDMLRDMLPVIESDEFEDDALAARIYRTLSKYLGNSPDVLPEVVDILFEATMRADDDSRTWTQWAYASHLLAQVEEDAESSDRNALNAVSGFLRASLLKQTNTVEYLIQMFAIFFKVRDSSLIVDSLIEDLLELPPSMFVQVVPQVTVQIAHDDEIIRGIVHKLILKFGADHFQAIVFPLNLYTQTNDDDAKSSAASELLHKLSKKHRDEAADAKLFVEGMLDAALTPFERWALALDSAAYAHREGDGNRVKKILTEIFKKTHEPRSDLERRFLKLNAQNINSAQAMFKMNTQKSQSTMWAKLKDLYDVFVDKTNKLEIILLPRVNEALSLRRDFTIVVPGTYSIEKSSPLIHMIENGLQVLSTQQHPRILHIVNSEGQRVKFLLKGSEDLRLDQRVMQFFMLVNSLLRHSRTMVDYKAQIVEYPIIPLAPSAGLITWVTNADTLHQMICDMRYAYQQTEVPEFEVLNECTSGLFGQLTQIQRLEMFYEIADVCHANEVRDFLWTHASSAPQWLQTSNNFCMSTALMSMIGYVIGLGDRHPSNIMVQRDTGRVIHIDFGDTFEKTIFRASFPEKVPFRLTRMIVHALDGGHVDGMFSEMACNVMEVLRANKGSLVALLEIFIHEPIEESSGGDKSGHQPPTKIIARVEDKLAGREMMEEFHRQTDVKEQVASLIKVATDETNYVTHYAGWCPYW